MSLMPKKKLGCGPLAAILLILVILLLIGSNEATGFYFTNCKGIDIMDCLMDDLEETEPEGAVVASGVYEWKGYTVNITMNIPLEGGTVTGVVSGTCDGKVTGTYNGQSNGVISGSMSGVCAPFFINIPSSADFTGSVNKSGKTVPISFTGRGGGLSHQGSMTLTYP